MSIRVLDDRLINQIAAGEVVERPASIVKELVENALDAGARTVRVALRGGGRSQVRIEDDGSGMSPDDALMCLERHATSKIRSADDLAVVGTLGFRGEAIPSIAAVCRFQLTTRPHDALVGTEIRVEGGRVQSVKDAGCAPGTVVDCRSLFFNLPVRAKFLRTASTELGHCVEAVAREALARPDVDFEVVHEGRDVLRAPPTDALGRARAVIGDEASSLVPVAFASGAYRVEGLVAPAGVHRAGRVGSSYAYVNGRFVRDAVVHRALAEAYRGLLPSGRHPIVVLRLALPPEQVDVNVHPAKTEVRFRDPRAVTEALAEAIRGALHAHGERRMHRPTRATATQPSDQPRLPLPAHPDEDPRLGARAAPSGLWAADVAPEPSGGGVAAAASPPLAAASPAPVAARAPAEPPPAAPPPASPPAARVDVATDRPSTAPAREALPAPARRFIGVHGGRWIVSEGVDAALELVDGRAARAEVLRDRLARDLARGEGSAERLLQPVLVPLPRADVEVLVAHRALLESLHLVLTHLGPGEIVARAVPAAITHLEVPALLAELAVALRADGSAQAAIGALAAHAAALGAVGEVEARRLLAALTEIGAAVPVARLDAPDLERLARR